MNNTLGFPHSSYWSLISLYKTMFSYFFVFVSLYKLSNQNGRVLFQITNPAMGVRWLVDHSTMTAAVVEVVVVEWSKHLTPMAGDHVAVWWLHWPWMAVQHLLIEASGLSDTNGSIWKINQFPQITEVNSWVAVLGKTLSYHTASVHPAAMSTWWNKNW